METAREVLEREPLPERSSTITDAFLAREKRTGRIVCLGTSLTGQNVAEKLANEMKLLQGDNVKVVAFTGPAGSGRELLPHDLSMEVREDLKTTILDSHSYLLGSKEERGIIEQRYGFDPWGRINFARFWNDTERLMALKMGETMEISRYNPVTGRTGTHDNFKKVGSSDLILVQGGWAFLPPELLSSSVYCYAPDEFLLASRLQRHVHERHIAIDEVIRRFIGRHNARVKFMARPLPKAAHFVIRGSENESGEPRYDLYRNNERDENEYRAIIDTIRKRLKILFNNPFVEDFGPFSHLCAQFRYLKDREINDREILQGVIFGSEFGVYTHAPKFINDLLQEETILREQIRVCLTRALGNFDAGFNDDFDGDVARTDSVLQFRKILEDLLDFLET